MSQEGVHLSKGNLTAATTQYDSSSPATMSFAYSSSGKHILFCLRVEKGNINLFRDRLAVKMGERKSVKTMLKEKKFRWDLHELG